jgi:tRNA/tmRNA/rRNA uracil-C5-methylase (TrmA/RlmC/RlmD family)
MRSKRMKKGQIAEGNVTTVEFPNKGIVMTDEGERVIVKNTIPGQRVSFAVNKVRKGKAEGNREEIATGDRRYLPAFRTVRRMYVSESAL